MAKKKSIFVCQECGYESNGWMGKCPACTQWNTFAEEIINLNKNTMGSQCKKTVNKPLTISEIKVEDAKRFKTGINELDRVLGGGLVKGSLTLIGGDPGIGKSTLILQMCQKLSFSQNILYVSGEESVSQIKLRADRLSVTGDKLKMVSETDFSNIEPLLSDSIADVVVIDSIQTMFLPEMSSAPGSVGQVREVTSRLMRTAKTTGISIIIVGHVTKEGSLAGPRVLEHMVDTVLYFEGERNLYYRILRSVKNRFGSTNELGMFEMKSVGLVEVENPSVIMISGRPENVPGTVVVCIIEGTRPMLIEVQALTSHTAFGMPRRMATGLDYNRVTMLLAVLEKKVKLELHNHDAYVNIVGGLKVSETACDLGVVLAVASSYKNRYIPADTVVIGEVGLTGEVRSISQVDKRVMEAMRNGFKKIILPSTSYRIIKDNKEFKDIELISVENLKDALENIFK